MAAAQDCMSAWLCTCMLPPALTGDAAQNLHNARGRACVAPEHFLQVSEVRRSVPTSSVRGCRREGAPPCLALCTASLPRSAPLLGTHPPGFLSYTKSTWDWRDHRQACEGRSPQGSCTGLCLHHPARVMPALADACHLFPSPRLAPHEMPGTPTPCPHHLTDQGQGVHVPWSLLTTLSQSERGLLW